MKSSKPSTRKSMKVKKSSNAPKVRSTAPVAYSDPMAGGRKPKINTGSNGSMCVRHSEYFWPVAVPSTAYRVDSFAVNPGDTNVFPWLSGLATHYESYKFRKLTFRYHARTATSTTGVVGMVFDFDVQDPAPLSQVDALSIADKTSDVPWNSHTLNVNLQGDRYPARYVSVGGTIDATTHIVSDPKTYDVGRLSVFCEGVNVTSTIGIVEVEYDVELITPTNPEYLGGVWHGTAGLDKNNLFGTAGSADLQGVLPFQVTAANTATFVTKWSGLLILRFLGAGISAAGSTMVVNGRGSAVPIFITTDFGQTGGTIGWAVDFYPGDYVVPSITAGTITDTQWYCGGTCPKRQVDLM